MAYLVIEQPGVPPMTVELKPPEMGFGRAEDNSVVLVADEVSRHHAKLVIRDGRIILNDLKSLNGTYVNRQRIAERLLNDKDEIWFGSKCRAIFKGDPPDATKPRLPSDSQLEEELEQLRATMASVEASMTRVMPSQLDTPIETAQSRQFRHAFRRLDALYKATQLIASDFNLQQRMSSVLDLAIEVTKAERGFVLVLDKDTRELKASVARQMGQGLDASSPSMTIARKAVEGQPVLMESPDSDASFSGRESIVVQRISSAMCVPLRTEHGILGALYVDTTVPETRFTKEDMELFQAMANQSALAIDNVNLYEKMVASEKKRNSFERFLSPAIVEVLMRQDTDVELGGRKQEVTMLFCDIRGFTPLSEGLAPDALVNLMNEHFTAMTEIVFENRGTLDKFIGDEVMALFGAPFETGDDAIYAVRTALEMQARNNALNDIRRQKGLPILEIGIGVNTGEVFAGYIGSPKRLDFSVIGDNVNVAARLCSVARGGQIVIGEGTYAKVSEHFETRMTGTPVLKGKAEPIQTYEVIRATSGPTPTGSVKTPTTR